MLSAIAATSVGDGVDVQPVYAVHATHGVAADCGALHRCGYRDDGEHSHAAIRGQQTLHTGSRVAASQMNCCRGLYESCRDNSMLYGLPPEKWAAHR